MKIALCISGFVGRKDKINGNPYSNNYSEYICLDYSSKYIKDYIIANHDVDIFVHSFDLNLKNKILETYEPTDSIIEKQIDNFIISPKNDHDFRSMSQWYSKMKSVELKKSYEIKNNMKYDWVVLCRFDFGYSKSINYVELNREKIYISDGWGPHPDEIKKIQDIIFIANSENMDKISTFYNDMDKLILNENIHFTEYDYFKLNNLIKHTEFYYKNSRNSSKLNETINIFSLRTEKECIWKKI